MSFIRIEKFIHEQTTCFLENNELLTEKPSGFRANRTVVDAELELNKFMFKSLNRKEVIGAVYKDCRKAFDTINHTILIPKYPKYGFSQNSLNWFMSYLGDSVQKSIANGQY